MVSVIVPVYNAERYLKFTLDSILNQTYRDFELICIDDGSTDESLNILKQYEQKDSRVRLFFSEDGTNYGVSHARNVGLNHAQGEYILFFDCDDLMEKDQIEIMTNEIRQHNVQLVIGKYMTISPGGGETQGRGSQWNGRALSGFGTSKRLDVDSAPAGQ